MFCKEHQLIQPYIHTYINCECHASSLIQVHCHSSAIPPPTTIPITTTGSSPIEASVDDGGALTTGASIGVAIGVIIVICGVSFGIALIFLR